MITGMLTRPATHMFFERGEMAVKHARARDNSFLRPQSHTSATEDGYEEISVDINTATRTQTLN